MGIIYTTINKDDYINYKSMGLIKSNLKVRYVAFSNIFELFKFLSHIYPKSFFLRFIFIQNRQNYTKLKIIDDKKDYILLKKNIKEEHSKFR